MEESSRNPDEISNASVEVGDSPANNHTHKSETGSEAESTSTTSHSAEPSKLGNQEDANEIETTINMDVDDEIKNTNEAKRKRENNQDLLYETNELSLSVFDLPTYINGKKFNQMVLDQMMKSEKEGEHNNNNNNIDDKDNDANVNPHNDNNIQNSLIDFIANGNKQFGIVSVKKIVNVNFGVIEFEDKERREFAQNKLKNFYFKSKKLKVQLSRKKKKVTNDQIEEARKRKEEKGETIKSIEDITTPWHWKPYEEQISDKLGELKRILRSIVTQMTSRKSKIQAPDWIKKLKKDDLFCDINKVIESPEKERYRNKCVFTIGKTRNGEKMIGHNEGNFNKNLNFYVADPSNVRNISEKALKIRNLMQKHIEESELEVYDKANNTGFYRTLTVKTFTNDGLVILLVDPKNVAQEILENEKNKLKNIFANEKEIGVYMQYYSGNSEPSGDLDFEWLTGPKSAKEKIMGLEFIISPSSFFQVNTKAAERLYEEIRRLASPDQHTIVLDICCGTGTIGLSMANDAKEVYGVELDHGAVESAKQNAQLNNITNAHFFEGKAEEIIVEKILKRLTPKHDVNSESGDPTPTPKYNVVAIVDPPRPGLHINVIRAIRHCEQINKLIYVSCNQKSFMNDAIHFSKCASNRFVGEPFRPVGATMVDLFPLTEKVELVVAFER